MSGTMIQTLKEEDDSYMVQTEKPKIAPRLRFSIRPATEGDMPELKKIRRDMGIHDVPTVFQTFMKLDPEGLKIAVDETGNLRLVMFCLCGMPHLILHSVLQS
ncbi:hypothetical protein AVEN_32910-1 [Araneus ventricosus]|uniref:Uncharacterized protein n=1 Tax=Araneus ventricosus TaxID=182803 RepID=A0A4Y2BBL5_ARAVE|nr:hypothetical protein AVEN_32910-1 [Araneus ventricosus]